MATDVIIEGLKASNAIEEDMLEKTKQGFEIIIDSMLQEYRKRNARYWRI